MRIYLAGPMSGYVECNFPAFHAEAARLRSLGHDVVNPAELNAGPPKPWAECMRVDLRELLTCDAIALLPGWRQSTGATLEHHVATALGMPAMQAADVPAAALAA